MSVNIYDKKTGKLIKIAGNANGVIDDVNVSNKTTYSSDKIAKEIDNSINGVVTENLNGKKLRPKTQSEYDALSDEEKNKEDIIYLITDYTGNRVVSEPTLSKRLLLALGSCDYQTGAEIVDDKKARTDYISVTAGETIDFDYNGLWGIARCYDSSKQFLLTAPATGGSSDRLQPTGLHDYGTYTIPDNAAYVRLVFGLDSNASIATSNNNVSGYNIKFGDTIYNTISY